MVVAAAVLGSQPQLYRARAVLLVGSSLESLNPGSSTLEASAGLARMYADLARCPRTLQPVIDQLRLSVTPERLARHVTAEARSGSPVLEISAVAGHPRTAEAVANAVAQALIGQAPAAREDVQAEMAFTAKQLEQLRKEVATLEDRLRMARAEEAWGPTPASLEDSGSDSSQLSAMLEAQRAAYAQLLALHQAGTSNLLTLIDPASGAQPVGRPMGLVPLAGLAGLVVTGSALVLKQGLDDRLRWDEAMRSCLGLSVLGAIGRLPADAAPLFYRRDPTLPDAAAVRDIVASLYLGAPGREWRTVLVTSPTTGDGKSTLAANLAAAAAALGFDTVLVDANLRYPTVHEALGIANDRGLGEVLREGGPKQQAALRRIVRPGGQPHLWAITAGHATLPQSLALAWARLRDILRLLKARYRFVIVDGPAEELGPDASVLARLVDATVMVLNQESARREPTWRCRQALTEGPNANLAGVVFNRVRRKGTVIPVLGQHAREEPQADRARSSRARTQKAAGATTRARPKATGSTRGSRPVRKPPRPADQPPVEAAEPAQATPTT
jgi:Mrp family chromosome partitioning ATPase